MCQLLLETTVFLATSSMPPQVSPERPPRRAASPPASLARPKSSAGSGGTRAASRPLAQEPAGCRFGPVRSEDADAVAAEPFVDVEEEGSWCGAGGLHGHEAGQDRFSAQAAASLAWSTSVNSGAVARHDGNRNHPAQGRRSVPGGVRATDSGLTLTALPSSRTPCRQGRRHRAGTDACSRERPSTAQPHAAPAP